MLGALVIEVPLSAALAAARLRAILLSLGMLGALGVFVLFVIFMQNRLVVRPVHELKQVAGHLAQGELDVGLEVRSNDEVGQIADAFRNLIDYIKDVARVATGMSEGDLTSDIHPQSNRDVLGNAFAQMTASLRALIGQVLTTAHSVGSASGELQMSAKHSSAAAQEVAVTMQQMAQSASQQTESVTEAATTVRQVEQVVDSVAKGAQIQTDAVDRLAGVTSHIAQAASQVAESARHMEAIKEMVDLSSDKVQEMGRRSQQIGTITVTLDELAAQTNLLALNAAIEAARAKEHGRGFSVVASQVRELAQSSRTATQEIAVLIREVQTSVDEAVSSMEVSASEVDRQVGEISTIIKQMTDSSNDLVRAMDTVSQVVEQNTAAAAQMATGAGAVTEAIGHISTTTHENNVATQQISSAMSEVTENVKTVSDAAESLAAMADALLLEIGRFRV
jgi:methyl-accepting chemotaxis protein